jgi:hypothetical protein
LVWSTSPPPDQRGHKRVYQEKKTPVESQAFGRGIRLVGELPATAAAAVSTTTATVAASATAATLAGASLLSLVHPQSTSVKFGTVEGLDGLVGLFHSGHLHEAEAPRATGLTVSKDDRVLDIAVLGKDIVEFVGSHGPGEVPDIQFLGHDGFPSLRQSDLAHKWKPKQWRNGLVVFFGPVSVTEDCTLLQG